MGMTQDGYDWPNNVQDERWPADKYQPAAPYFREQLTPDEERELQAMIREDIDRRCRSDDEARRCMACRLPFRTHDCRCVG